MITIRHPGVSCATTARALGVRPTKATQAREPAIRKVAALLIADPIGTAVMLAEACVAEEQRILRDRMKTGGNR